MITPQTFREEFRVFAIDAHDGQRYGKHDYAYHLAMVEQVLVEFEFTSIIYRAGAWLHDILEDTPVTRERVRELFGTEVEELAWACTGVGTNRKERNGSIREKINDFPLAAPLKLADRIANVRQSRLEGSRQLEMYRNENSSFAEYIEPHVPKVMWTHLCELFTT